MSTTNGPSATSRIFVGVNGIFGRATVLATLAAAILPLWCQSLEAASPRMSRMQRGRVADSNVRPTQYEGAIEIVSGDSDVIFSESDEFFLDEPGISYGGTQGRRYAGGDYWNDPASDRGYTDRPYWKWMRGRLWFREEYLVWWPQGSFMPPAATTSPQGTPQAQAGVLGQDTSVLFGNSDINNNARSGGRFAVGTWLGCERRWGVEGIYTMLGKETDEFVLASDGDPILARPFFNIEGGQQGNDAALLAYPGIVRGGTTLWATSRFQGIELLFRRGMFTQGDNQISLLFGYRYNRLDDGLRMQDALVSTDALSGFAAGTTLTSFDQFDAQNKFSGAELGVIGQMQHERWSLEASMKLAFGSTNARVTIDGSTTTTVVGQAPVVTAGGLLAQSTNIGVYRQNDFTMVPEMGVTLGYDLTCRLRLTAGYSFIYWSRVARSADQIDMNLNLSQQAGNLVGAPRPAFQWNMSDLWVQGLNFGVNYRF